MVDHGMHRASGNGQPGIALAVLLVLGVLSLPVTAYFLDGDGSENWIHPGRRPRHGRARHGGRLGDAGPGRWLGHVASGAVVGALVGVGMLVLGVVLFFLLLRGFDGS